VSVLNVSLSLKFVSVFNDDYHLLAGSAYNIAMLVWEGSNQMATVPTSAETL
jgi:hypothetical protein